MTHKNTAFIMTLWLFLVITSLFSATKRIMPLGDSITYGNSFDNLSSHYIEGYRGPLYRKLSDVNFTVDFVGTVQAGKSVVPAFDIDNEGHPGETSHYIAQHVYSYLNATQPEVILLHIGTNDHSSSVSGVESILNEIDHYERNSGRTIRVIVAMIINRQGHDGIIASFNHNIKALVDKRWQNGDILSLVDMPTNAALTSSDYADNTHPNTQGYTKMANVWFKAITTPYVPISTGPFTQDDDIDAQTGTIVSINVLINDKDYQNDMDISSINFVGGSNTLTVANQGKWSANENGIVTFEPNSNFTSDPTPVLYTVKDKEATESKPATITINYSNASLGTFPTTIVPEIYIESISIDEHTNSVTFITRVPNDGIRF